VEPDAFTGLDTVRFLKLAFMDLSSLKPFTFRGLSHVHVLAIQDSDLGIIRADAFEGMTQIGILNLQNNKIDAIQELSLRPANRIKIFHFHGNHLLEIPLLGAVSIQGVEVLNVTDNHFPCDCHVHTLLESPLANDTTKTDFRSKNYCISPLEVNGKPISDLDLDSIGRCQEQVTRGNLEASKGSVRSGGTETSLLSDSVIIIYLLAVFGQR
jgi:hypothetical protein